MKTLIPILTLSVLFAHLTQITGGRRLNKLFFVALLCTLALPIGLRRIYNDTGAYIASFQNSLPLGELLTSGKLHLLGNPLYEAYKSLVRTFTDNYHIYFLIPAFFTQYAFVALIRRYCDSFALGIGLYICLGTYVLSMAAMKQTAAMGVLMLAVPKLAEKRYARFYLLVFVASLIHTYAIAFAVLPLFMGKPWKAGTFLLLLAVCVVMQNFEAIMGSFRDYANAQGKVLSEHELFNSARINPFRVAVYALVPLMSLLLRPCLFRGKYDPAYHILIHMSLLSFACMLLGTVSGANMFGRMANYFELGLVCSLGWIVNRAFNRRSARLIFCIAAGCFLFYFYYAYKITLDFDEHYRAVTIAAFIRSLWR